jgi:hypothetical protein
MPLTAIVGLLAGAVLALLPEVANAQAQPVTISVTGSSGHAGDFCGCVRAVSVSETGRFVAFVSDRSDIVPGDTNGSDDVFVADTRTGKTQRVSVSSSGRQANGQSYGPTSISADGRFVLFGSDASNLVPNDTNQFGDVFLRDRVLGTTTRVPRLTVFVGGTWVMSSNARFFAWGPPGHDNTVYRMDRATNHVITGRVGQDEAGVLGISDDGRTVLVVGSGGPRIWKPVSGRLLQATQTINGRPPNRAVDLNALSADGTRVLFTSSASNLVHGDSNGVADVFVRNLVTHRTRRVSVGSNGRQTNGASSGLALSRHGRRRLFSSRATNLVGGDTNGLPDIFLRSGPGASTTRCDVASDGTQANRATLYGALSFDGLHAVFFSEAANLVAGDTNHRRDIFERGPGC